jgi:mRNA degradation ribonuclease J1/J2
MLRPGDSVLLSSHTIPGNEKAVVGMINDLVRI